MTDNVIEINSIKTPKTEDLQNNLEQESCTECGGSLDEGDPLTNDAFKITEQIFEDVMHLLIDNGISSEDPSYGAMFSSLIQSMTYTRKALFEEMISFQD